MENDLREWLSEGTYGPGDTLPPQRELAVIFGVSRDTVQKALKPLVEEGLVSSRQGSGIKVLRAASGVTPEPSPGRPGRRTLGPVIRKAFESPAVSLDVYTLTAETLVGHIRVQAERIMAREITPERVTVRMMLPSTDEPRPYPRAVEPGDHRVWDRFRDIAQQREEEMRYLLAQFPPGIEVAVKIRKVPLIPEFKLYVFNDSEMLFGPYVPVRLEIPVGGDAVPALDVLGLRSPLTFHQREEDAESHDSVFFSSMQDWFESVWDQLGTPGVGN
ncbi:GntR family transcriptional regulator [Streptomyces sp. HD]|uniref:GntR family transcriptional regulator n=1 Tax=Streptomyces sp. HD TaxID=3020892 RepID=UPI00232CEEA4|nr:GntR family transcriptional regulator [Streptomyces sp. HD]MDC0770233.1 GntR family transcriptional regulator [Streptomyces sp. HD]